MQEGENAGNFELTANDGSIVSLDSFKNKKNVVLCFYPKNHLFACPSKKIFKMAKSVIAAYPDITSRDSVLFAISIDTVESQRKFVEEYNIPYLHLSDTKKDDAARFRRCRLPHPRGCIGAGLQRPRPIGGCVSEPRAILG